MKTIVTGRFSAEKQAARAVDKLLHSCIRGDHVHAFFLDSPHGHPVRRRRLQSWRLGHPSEKAIEIDIGPASVADGVEIKAYVGTLPDAVARTGGEERASSPETGILVAVETTDHVSQALAMNVLQQHGARSIECAEGARRESEWRGFQPVPLSTLLEPSATDLPVDDLRGVTRH